MISSVRLDFRRMALALGVVLAGALCSCQTVEVSEIGYLQQPNMKFEDSGPFAYECGLLGQIETGRAISVGAAGSGCNSCH
ncbi:MAG TPA: hypothetical protein VMN36_00405 [Verrucomicrobiales bacterium]|nr:hypothetical protein [Verrucomicrobiales bacterium]